MLGWVWFQAGVGASACLDFLMILEFFVGSIVCRGSAAVGLMPVYFAFLGCDSMRR